MLYVLRLVRLLLFVALALWASTAAAQPHPCDVQPVSGDTAPEGYVTLGWCHPDTGLGWRLYVDGVPITLTNVRTNFVRSATGEMLYSATVRFTRGTYTLALAAVSVVGESPQSVPFRLRCQRART